MLCKFPKVLSELRCQKGLSQKDAAKDLGISPALLSHYENGIRECGLDFLLSLSDYYSVSCDYLLGKSTIKNPVVYEAEPEALAIDNILKSAAQHNDAVREILGDIADVEAYRMMRSLCDTAQRSNSFTFELESTDYKSLCAGALGCLYSKLCDVGKQKKKLSASVYEVTSGEIEKAENLLKKY